MIDLWGSGYDVAEKMGILTALQQCGYTMDALKMVDKNGGTRAQLNMQSLSKLTNERFLSIPRSDVSRILYNACVDIPCRFGNYITGISESDNFIEVSLSDGTKENVDVVVGADVLHSAVREQVFGKEHSFVKNMQINVGAFTVTNYDKYDPNNYIVHQGIGKQLARVTLRNNKTLFLFTFKMSATPLPPSVKAQKQLIQDVFSDTQWEAPTIRHLLENTDDFYFDHVSQIRMDSWSKGRTVLVGDAAACPSLLAGEGTGLAMTEAYVLTGELAKAEGDYALAFARYEDKLKKFVTKKQDRASNMVSFFVPTNACQRKLLQWGISAANWPLIAKLFLGATLTDEFALPEYGE